MPKTLEIQSYKGPYSVLFTDSALSEVSKLSPETSQLIIDSQVYSLYKKQFDEHLGNFKKILIVADENNKNIDKISGYVAKLTENNIKLSHTLIAIGGGIIQDITCFMAATLFRGMKWAFVPTTLLAQADSCIGSKSSINVGPFKNLMGTFTPPLNIYLDTTFLNTLEERDISSGIGEILKVHMVKGISYFEEAIKAIDEMKRSRPTLNSFIEKSLLYKKELIEKDEFDKGIRNVMNYGHSFGHAIESTTNFAIPHGVAVTIGMDMANFQSYKMERISKVQFLNWHKSLFQNYKDFSGVKIDLDGFSAAIRKDKKNVDADLSLILVKNSGPIEKVRVPFNEEFLKNCQEFLNGYIGQESL